MTRRRFLAVASGVPVVTAAKAWDMAVAAQESGFEARFDEAARLIRAQTDSGEVAAAVLHVRRAGHEMSRAFGTARVDLPFLLASPTKPMTASVCCGCAIDASWR